ncbi:hypothetical protein CPB84DRAFT_1220945 [Gymnopilus junonius]|uniref:Uncharacterized protein n=1 Tax=Gymnopilus junonius TaxID=109634 RepID=A0A9P5P074_GYMJU|nr:hypothetical protein CPB84DRAFT_1220945 [Gymnopilus junonius]
MRMLTSYLWLYVRPQRFDAMLIAFAYLSFFPSPTISLLTSASNGLQSSGDWRNGTFASTSFSRGERRRMLLIQLGEASGSNPYIKCELWNILQMLSVFLCPQVSSGKPYDLYISFGIINDSSCPGYL